MHGSFESSMFTLFSFSATEVRCQEKTRGGLCYEVILGMPEAKTNPPKRTSSPNRNVSAQDIEEKLKAAEERRQVGGSKKQNKFSLYNFVLCIAIGIV